MKPPGNAEGVQHSKEYSSKEVKFPKSWQYSSVPNNSRLVINDDQIYFPDNLNSEFSHPDGLPTTW